MKYTYLIDVLGVGKILLVVIILFMCLAIPVYCQDNSRNNATKTIAGSVTSLDWVRATLVVNDMALSLSSNASIHKGTNRIGLDAMHIGDMVTVTYYDEPSGIHKAVTIAVQ